jgi:AcrR family transcriptional regulator
MPSKIKKLSDSSENSESVRESLLAAARRLFAQKGFDGVSVKDLAEATGHNAALVNYYFKSKEGLYRECVMPLLGAGKSNMQRILRTPTSKQDFLTRFHLFIEDFTVSHLEEVDLCVILKRDSNTQVVKKLYKEHFTVLHDHLHNFLKAAKKAKFLLSEVDTEFATHFILSSLFQLITSERFRLEIGETVFLEDSRREKTIQQIGHYFTYGIVAQTR